MSFSGNRSTPAHDPPIILGPLGAFPELDGVPSSALVLIDDGVPAEFDEEISAAVTRTAIQEVVTVRLAGGEPRKSADGWGELVDLCAEAGLDRDAILIAVGGGALGDAVGFTAATWHRGIRWIAVPTTLLAMIDAHIGGKTALNRGTVKNRLGAFWWPEGVLVDTEFLASLPDREMRSGWGELIKSAVIGDAPLFSALEDECTGSPQMRRPTVGEIAAAIAVKQRVVAEDPREGDRRRVLNLGHTLGHALEAVRPGEFTHGEAVSVGLVFAAELAADLGLAPRSLSGRIGCVLSRFGLPSRWPIDRGEELLSTIAADKKNRGGQSWFVLPTDPGTVELAPVATEIIARRLAAGPEGDEGR